MLSVGWSGEELVIVVGKTLKRSHGMKFALFGESL